MKKLDKKLLLLNVFMLIFELIGFFLSINEIGSSIFIYYTELSNMLLLFTSMIYIYYILFNKKIDKWFNILKEISVVSVIVTFIVVLFLLIPYQNFDFKGLLLNGSMLYHHLICPLLGLVMFLFFDKEKPNKKDYLYANSFSVIYAIIFTILNILKVLEGPYFFLLVYKNPIYMSLMWIILIPLVTFLLSKLVCNLKYKVLTK